MYHRQTRSFHLLFLGIDAKIVEWLLNQTSSIWISICAFNYTIDQTTFHFDFQQFHGVSILPHQLLFLLIFFFCLDSDIWFKFSTEFFTSILFIVILLGVCASKKIHDQNVRYLRTLPGQEQTRVSHLNSFWSCSRHQQGPIDQRRL